MTDDANVEYDGIILLEIQEKKLKQEEIEAFNNIPELSFSSVNFVLNSEENEIKLKMKVPFTYNYVELTLVNIDKIDLFSSNGHWIKTSQSNDELTIEKLEAGIIFIHIFSQPNSNVVMSIKKYSERIKFLF